MSPPDDSFVSGDASYPYPGRHVVSVGVPVVVVQHQHSQNHAGRHHPLDEVEVRP